MTMTPQSETDTDDPGFVPLIGALLLFAGFGPALGITGYWPVFDLGVVGSLGFSGTCGAVGGALLGRTSRAVGVLGGSLVGTGAFISVLLYTMFIRTDEVWNIEVALIGALGALPGGFLWQKLAPQLTSKNDE